MKTYLIIALLGGLGGLVIGWLDSMTDRTLATVLGLALTAVSFVAFSKWVDTK